MTQQATGTAVVSAGGQMPATTKKIDVLKNMLSAPSVVEQFKKCFG